MKSKFAILIVLFLFALVLLPAPASSAAQEWSASGSGQSASNLPAGEVRFPAAPGLANTVPGNITDLNALPMSNVTVQLMEKIYSVYLPLVVKAGSGARDGLEQPPEQPGWSAESEAIMQRSLHDPLVFTTTTNSQGDFIFNSVPEGKYILSAEGFYGYEPSEYLVEVPGQAGEYDFVAQIITYLAPIIPEETNVLTETTTQYLESISPDRSVITFTQSTPDLAQISPGEVIVSGPTVAAPHGFLRKVVSAGRVGEAVVFQTEQATLEDAIQQGGFIVEKELTPADIQRAEFAPGVNMRAAQQDVFSLEINDFVIYDKDGNPGTTHDQVVANGSLEFEPGFTFSPQYEGWELTQLYFVMRNKETAELEIEYKLGLLSIDGEKELARFTLANIVVWVDPVPVVITPELNVILGADGSVSIGVTTSVSQELQVAGGLKYLNGQWSVIKETRNSFTFQPPQVYAGIDAKGYAETRLGLYLYGVIGPYANQDVFVKYEAKTTEQPCCKLWGGVEMPVGVRVEVVSHKIAQHEALAFAYQKLLWKTQVGGMVFVPAGEFQMGCDPAHNGGYGCSSTELPLHTVYLDPFYIDQTEVTNGQYASFLNVTGNQSEGGATWFDAVDPDANIHLVNSTWQADPAYTDHPVIEVTWYGARAYCTWAGKRLPTEAEWEKAARGPTPRAYPWGDASPTCSLVNGFVNGQCVGDTSRVGSYPSGASPYGALDMAGNVGEWVNDWYGSNYYCAGPNATTSSPWSYCSSSSPPYLSPWSTPPGPDSGIYRVQRGGYWLDSGYYLRSAGRDTSYPSGSSDDIGFRCARSP